MFYVKQIQGKDVYCSDFLDNLEHFFTSRDLIVKENLDLISSYLNIKKDNKTVLKMQKLYNSKPENIIAAIGPCISFQHFETSDEAIYMLSKTITDTKGLFKDNYADLKGINERQLREIGVEKIDICPYCTVENNDKFFSYRKENATKLRHSAIIKLKS